MHTLRVVTDIRAPADRCFDLARSVEAHLHSAGSTGERAVGGRTSGLLELGEFVDWEARHLGITQRLSGRITKFEPPTYFQDRMERGAFKSLEHDHLFEAIDEQTTRMTDVIRFAAPIGAVGWLAERIVVGPHLQRFLAGRGRALKELAETEGWRRFLPDPRG